MVNILFVLLLLGVYLGAYLPSETCPYLSLFSYIYPFVLLVNVLFCLLWIFCKWKYLIVPLAAIIAGYDYIPRFFGTNESITAEGKQLRVLTYNVKGFGHKVGEDRESRVDNADSIFMVIKMKNPDIVCLQEYGSAKRGDNIFHAKMDRIGYEYYYAPKDTKHYVGGSVIYSKKPIIRSGCLFPMKKDFYSFAFADILSGKDTLRIYNLHLASYMIFDEEKAEIGAISEGKIPNEETSRSVVGKLLSANQERSVETQEMVKILKETQLRYIMVGDMNSTPYSYTYQQFSRLAKDAFRERGSGFSGTYNGELPPFRIDYVFLSEGVKALHYESGDYDYSDHQPVVVEFQFDKAK